MILSDNYNKGLIFLAHLLIGTDGVLDEREIRALNNLKSHENISQNVFDSYQSIIINSKERDIYQQGVQLISACTAEERIRAFCWLYKLTEVDDKVHAKEVRFLLYSVKAAKVEFGQVVDEAQGFPSVL